MVERVPAGFCRVDEDLQVRPRRLLAGELGKGQRAQGRLEIVCSLFRRGQAAGIGQRINFRRAWWRLAYYARRPNDQNRNSPDPTRHGRAWPGHPRLFCVNPKARILGPSPRMTARRTSAPAPATPAGSASSPRRPRRPVASAAATAAEACGLGIAEIDERGDRVGHGLRAPSCRRRHPRGGSAPGRRRRKAGALSFSSATMRAASFGPTPGARAMAALSPVAMAVAKRAGIEHRENASATLAPTPCTVCSRRNHSRSWSERKPIEADHVLADMGLDGERQPPRRPWGRFCSVRDEQCTSSRRPARRR